MNTRGLLDQLLRSGQELLRQRGAPGARPGGVPGLGGLLGGQAGDLSGLVKGAGGGALGATALGLLLGNKSARKLGGKALAYGGLAALGVIAYKAYGNWQAQRGEPEKEPRTLDRLPPEEAEAHGQAILKALVGAAKADGHVDDRERALLRQQLGELAADRELGGWLEAELARPLDPVEIARAARSPEMASEMYLASVLMVDEEQFMERAYLDELARQLGLDPGLQAELERQVREAAA